MMAARLTPELESMIDINQSAFIRKRSVHDNFKSMQSAAKLFKQRKILKLLLKLGIAKAFDAVSWSFFLHVLEYRGFGPHRRNWMAMLLSPASTRVQLNGERGKPIDLARGLQQGHPISPMLFIVVMNVLHRLLNRVAQMNGIQQLGSRAATHHCPLYVDDAVLFIMPTDQDLTMTSAILNLFGVASSKPTCKSAWSHQYVAWKITWIKCASCYYARLLTSQSPP